MYAPSGFFRAGGTAWDVIQARDSTGAPVASDGAPTFRVTGEDGNEIGIAGVATAFNQVSYGAGSWKWTVSVTDPQFARGRTYKVRVTTMVSGVPQITYFAFQVT